MRKTLLGLILLIVAVVGFADDGLPALAVMPFAGSNLSEVEAGTPEIVQTLFEDALFQIGRYRVIDAAKLAEVLEAVDYQQTRRCDTDCAVGIGEQVSAQFVVFGVVGRLGGTYPLRARIFDVQNAKLLNSASVLCPSADDVALGSEELAYRLLQIPYDSKIVTATEPAPVPTAQVLPRICIRHQARGGRGIKESDWACTDGSFESDWLWTGDDSGYKHQKLRIMSTGQSRVCLQFTAARGRRQSEWACSSRSEESQWIWVGDDTGYKGQRLRVKSMGTEEVCIKHSRTGGRVIESDWTCSAHGSESPWITIGDDTGYGNQRLKIKVHAATKPAPTPDVLPVEQPGTAEGWLELLTSGISEQENNAAKALYRYHRADPSIFQPARDVLLAGYSTNLSDPYHVDAMAWLCTLLGSMNTPENAETLRTIVNTCQNRKIRGCAKDGLKELE